VQHAVSIALPLVGVERRAGIRAKQPPAHEHHAACLLEVPLDDHVAPEAVSRRQRILVDGIEATYLRQGLDAQRLDATQSVDERFGHAERTGLRSHADVSARKRAVETIRALAERDASPTPNSSE
jgi:hypothetical protein